MNILDELKVPDAVHKERLRICDSCPLIENKEGNIQESGYDCMESANCGDCGCFVWIKSNLKYFDQN